MAVAKENLISIALCTYNGELYIDEQLRSITDQSYKNIEIIIVDDCSSDQTLSIVQKHQIKDSRIKLYQNEKNLGFNSNFRKAISLCSGEHIAIADQDDIWIKDKLRIMIAAIGDNLLCYHNSEYINAEGALTGKSTLSAHRFIAGDCSKNLLFNNCVSGHASLIKKELLEITPGFPDKMYYDWWLAYTAACVGRINFTRETLVKYRIHQHSFTHKDSQHSKLLRIKNLRLFARHPLTPQSTKILLTEMLKGYTQTEKVFFSLKLFLVLLNAYTNLFYTRKRSIFSNIKFIFKESTQN